MKSTNAKLKGNRLFHGIWRGKRDVEDALQDALPKRAVIEFAWATDYWHAGTYHVEAVIYWSLDKTFYGAQIHRTIAGGEATPWQRSLFRPRLVVDKNNLQLHLEHLPEDNKALMMMDAVDRMIELERRWWAGEPENRKTLPWIMHTAGHSTAGEKTARRNQN